MWMSADAALALLRVKPQTLYANVSRGRIRAKGDPTDSRRSLYNRLDVERMARKTSGRPRAAVVAADSIRWGDPVLDSAVSTIADGHLLYRGADAIELAEAGSFEAVAGLLWQGAEPDLATTTGAAGDESPLGAIFHVLAARASVDLPSHGRSPASLRTDAAEVLAAVAAAVCGPGHGPAHLRLAARLGRPEAAEVLRATLVLLADHELNASTFAARVAVSTGASLAAGALAGAATVTGPLHGGASAAVQSLVRRAAETSAEAAVRERLEEGGLVPAFGHTLYPDGDPRAVALMGKIEVPALFSELAEAGERLTGEPPNIDFALAAAVAAYELPSGAAIRIFAMARTAGWLAHMLEQAETGSLIRPRARYVGANRPVPPVLPMRPGHS
jgi:citrate synthase